MIFFVLFKRKTSIIMPDYYYVMVQDEKSSIKPAEPNRYLCKQEDANYYKCTYYNFREIFMKHELGKGKNLEEINVPKHLPKFLHKAYLSYKVKKPVYLQGTENMSINKVSDHFSVYEKLIEEGECYLE